MPLTLKQRRLKNRANARKSTGPKTEQGKANSRKNAMTHGMRSETLAMQNEDPVAVAARTERWNDYYKPESPGAQHLVNVCVASTFLHDRVNRSHETAISSQVRSADHDWLCAKVDELEEMKTLLTENPATGLRLLNRTAMGCSWLLGRWKFYSAIYKERGYWSRDEMAEVLRLLGVEPAAPSLKRHVDAFQMRLFNNMAIAADPAETAAFHLAEDQCPDELWNAFDLAELPERRDFQNWIEQYTQDQMADLSQRGRTLEETIHKPDQAEAKDRALTLNDEKKARLFLRYNSEARTGFQRAFTTLVKTLEWDKEQAGNGKDFEEFDASPNEATFATEWDRYDRIEPLKASGDPECNPLPNGDLGESPTEADRGYKPITAAAFADGIMETVREVWGDTAAMDYPYNDMPSRLAASEGPETSSR